jgi:phosphoribosylaminoimidazolecarboxamide formyltransferase/IMP cyclohydrolase
MPHDAVKGALLDAVKIETALIVNVADSTGLNDLTNQLSNTYGVRVVTNVAEYTGFPAVLDGQVETFHPKIHGGILGVRGNATHEAEMKEHGIHNIDLVVVNLPTLNQEASNIDVQAFALTRSAAKNHRAVCIITNPNQYSQLLEELATNQGATTYQFRKKMAAAGFHSTAVYEATVSAHFE